MIETCSGASSRAELRLTDAAFEKAADIEGILNVVESIIDEDPDIGDVFENHLDIAMVRFAQKYQMNSILDAIKINLFDLVTNFPPIGGRFVLVAASLEEWSLCGRLVMALDSSGRSYPLYEEYDMRQALDWRGWTPKIILELSQISEMFLWAVCQVGTKHAKAAGYGQISYAMMGPDLAKIMNT
jgi:hypothetical protein